MFEDELSDAEETPAAVTNRARARARADALLASARAKADQSPSGQVTAAVTNSRVHEDRVLQHERARADEVLHRTRSEHVTVLSEERRATDQDLSNERARSDHALAMRDEFMGIVSHDLLNLLDTVVGRASLIEREAVKGAGEARDIEAGCSRA